MGAECACGARACQARCACDAVDAYLVRTQDARMQFPNHFRAWRQRAGLKQDQAVELLAGAGKKIDRSQLSKTEKGEVRAIQELLRAMSAVYGVPESWLLNYAPGTEPLQVERTPETVAIFDMLSALPKAQWAKFIEHSQTIAEGLKHAPSPPIAIDPIPDDLRDGAPRMAEGKRRSRKSRTI